MPVTCWVPTCKHNNMSHTCRFFRLPKNIVKRKEWLQIIKLVDEPNLRLSICSCHFPGGEKKIGPQLLTEHSTGTEGEPSTATVDIAAVTGTTEGEPFTATVEKVAVTGTTQMSLDSFKSENSTCQDVHMDSASEIQQPSSSMYQEGRIVSDTEKSSEVDLSSSEIPSTYEEFRDNLKGRSSLLEAENYFLKKELDAAKTFHRAAFSFDQICDNDKAISLYTGLPNRVVFNALYALVENIPINYYMGWNVEILSTKDQLFVMLMKLRQNFPHDDLAIRFNVSQSTISNIVLTWIHVLHDILYEQLMKEIPSKNKNMTCLPSSFSTFTNCRIILDCTEIATTASRKSMTTQKLTYSSYKHKNTWKALIGVAPNGVITYVSTLYPGSLSDKKIVQHSELLKKINPGDLILADKGFLLKDILPSGVDLNIPPFLVTPQFSEEQVHRTETIARARIHVERAIQRMKLYKILNFIPKTLVPHAGYIVQVVGALTNLQNPLINEVKDSYSSASEDSN